MGDANFFSLNLFDPSFIIFYLKDFNSAISLHLKHSALSPYVIFVPANVNDPIFFPSLSLSIESPLFVNLNCIVLLMRHGLKISLLSIEVSKVTLIRWSSIEHIAYVIAIAIAIEANERGIVQLSMVKHT